MTELRSDKENASIKSAFLREVRTSRPTFFGLILSQATHVSLVGDEMNVIFTDGRLGSVVNENRHYLEQVLYVISGRKMFVRGGLMLANTEENRRLVHGR